MRNIFSSRFVRDSGTLLSGNVIAQGVSFAAYLVLSRLFDTEDFGLYNIFYSYIEVLIILSTCKYELAIVRADSDEEASHLAHLTLRLNAIVTIAILTVALVISLFHISIIPLPSTLLILIPFMVFFCGTTRVYTFLFNRYKQYRHIATSEVVTSLSGVGLKIIFGLMNGVMTILHTLGLPLGTVLGKLAGNGYMRYQLRKKGIVIAKGERPMAIAKKHKNFPLYVMPKELVSSFSANLPIMWLSLYFDHALIGLFTMALTFTMRPLGILASGFEKVFYSSSLDKMRQGLPIWHDVRRFILVLNAITIPVLVVVFIFSEPTFTFLFGEKWVGTGYYVRCILPWFWVLLTTNSLAFVPNIFSTQKVDFFFQLAQLIMRIGALWVGCYKRDYHLAILLFCTVSTLVQFVQLCWYIYQVRTCNKKD